MVVIVWRNSFSMNDPHIFDMDNNSPPDSMFLLVANIDSNKVVPDLGNPTININSTISVS